MTVLWLLGFFAGLATRAVILLVRPAEWRRVAIAALLVVGYAIPLAIVAGPAILYHRPIG